MPIACFGKIRYLLWHPNFYNAKASRCMLLHIADQLFSACLLSAVL